MSIFFITGTSGAGKTVLTHLLKTHLSPSLFMVYDFDEMGVPSNPDKAWRLCTTGKWLTKAKENYEQKKSTIICGVSVPSEVRAIHEGSEIKLYFGFIKVDALIIEQRLADRGWSIQLIADNINWASYLEKEVKDQENHLIVESSTLSPQEVADYFMAWLLKNEV